jgi:DNA-binding XRE family transcriptional regulator
MRREYTVPKKREPVPLNRLGDLRRLRGWTQELLASHLGVARRDLRDIETHRVEPCLKLQSRAALLFEIAAEEIFDQKPKRRQHSPKSAGR